MTTEEGEYHRHTITTAIQIVAVSTDETLKPQQIYVEKCSDVVDSSTSNEKEADDNEIEPCKSVSCFSQLREVLLKLIKPYNVDNVIPTLLLRPSDTTPALYAYHDPTQRQPNVNATRLAMACGLFSYRFHGTVVIVRGTLSSLISLNVDDVIAACYITPDLREDTILSLSIEQSASICPKWLKDASKSNYLDGSVLRKLQVAMSPSTENNDPEKEVPDQIPYIATDGSTDQFDESEKDSTTMQCIAKQSLCLHCRRPASTLCSGCNGAYFCDLPNECKKECWSHKCICTSWCLYVSNRTLLSTFPLGDWHKELVSRPFQLSDSPYEIYLKNVLGINMGVWWQTELAGWLGGESHVARNIEITIRRSYECGFAPLNCGNIPVEDIISLNTHEGSNKLSVCRNELGFLRFNSWEDYYTVRGLNFDSIASLLLTFPLTLYYCLTEFGEVSCTVAKMLKRRLRIHIVGSEKELNFLDLFKELIYLIDDEASIPYGIELVFVVREDMIPKNGMGALHGGRHTKQFTIDLTHNLRVFLVSGTYGESSSLDPNFDCGTGPPDMIMAFNAGLYAYPSWHHVVSYLDTHPSVTGVFTDYNEFSAVQCASLGGTESRQSVRINPFRQPRAMCVHSMNLPQFCNGFIYVFNQQFLD